MTSYALSHALTPWDRVKLFADRVLAFRKGSGATPEIGGNNFTPKASVRYGITKRTAEQYVEGLFPGLSQSAIALKVGIDYESFRSSIYAVRVKRGLSTKYKRRAVA